MTGATTSIATAATDLRERIFGWYRIHLCNLPEKGVGKPKLRSELNLPRRPDNHHASNILPCRLDPLIHCIGFPFFFIPSRIFEAPADPYDVHSRIFMRQAKYTGTKRTGSRAPPMEWSDRYASSMLPAPPFAANIAAL